MDVTEKTARILSRILPGDIATDDLFYNAFGKIETEVSALWIVRFCKERGEGWAPIRASDLDKFYRGRKVSGASFLFNGLCDPEFLTLSTSDDGELVFTVTGEFVARCFASSPAPCGGEPGSVFRGGRSS